MGKAPHPKLISGHFIASSPLFLSSLLCLCSSSSWLTIPILFIDIIVFIVIIIRNRRHGKVKFEQEVHTSVFPLWSGLPNTTQFLVTSIHPHRPLRPHHPHCLHCPHCQKQQNRLKLYGKMLEWMKFQLQVHLCFRHY